uniref:EOG090X0O5J n=1 Tax=Daphnia galeata TaxID=27404 RepID=A0A8J2RW33_9CRUS|nr:unnamed protein product [Daphnia galeata]
MNSVTLLGRVGSNPVKRGSLEHPVVTFSLDTSQTIAIPMEKSAKKQNGTEFVESVLKFTNKGQRLLVQGRIIYGEVKENEGNFRHTCSIVAVDVISFKNGA